MGLAEVKRRTKISKDPNNTAWSRSNSNFGHKILAAQGWKPGDYLGAKDARQAAHFSAANASHIRVALREENLGLGAKRAGNNDIENNALGSLQDLFGRLSGKSKTALEKEAALRKDVGRRLYVEKRWGPLKFVRAGYLVGDSIQSEASIESMSVELNRQETSPTPVVVSEPKKKKDKSHVEDRKTSPHAPMHVSRGSRNPQTDAFIITEENAESSSEHEKRLRKEQRKAKKRRTQDEQNTNEAAGTSGKPKKRKIESGATSEQNLGEKVKEKEHKKKRRKHERTHGAAEDGQHGIHCNGMARTSEKIPEKAKRRKAPEQSREKHKNRESQEARNVFRTIDQQLGQHNACPSPKTTPDTSSTRNDAEVFSNPSGTTNASNNGMISVRQRFIKQKRVSSMDPTSLKEKDSHGQIVTEASDCNNVFCYKEVRGT